MTISYRAFRLKIKRKKKEKMCREKGGLQIIPAVGIIRKIYLRGDKKKESNPA